MTFPPVSKSTLGLANLGGGQKAVFLTLSSTFLSSRLSDQAPFVKFVRFCREKDFR